MGKTQDDGLESPSTTTTSPVSPSPTKPEATPEVEQHTAQTAAHQEIIKVALGVQQVPDEDVQARLAKAVLFEPLDALALLKRLHAAFPLNEGMSAGFKGTHALTLAPDGALQLNFWWKDMSYWVRFVREDITNWSAGEISETEKRLMAKLPQPDGDIQVEAAAVT